MGAVVAILVILIVFLIVSAVPIAMYILQGIGLSTMLKKCGFKKPWFAFVPMLNIFALGSLSEIYNNGKTQRKHYAKILTALYIVCLAASLVYGCAFGIAYAELLTTQLDGAEFTVEAILEILEQIENGEGLPDLFLTASLLSYVYSLVSMIYQVYFCITLYRVFRIFAPDSALAFSILCAFFSFLVPILLFTSRKNEPQNLIWQQDYDYPYPEL